MLLFSLINLLGVGEPLPSFAGSLPAPSALRSKGGPRWLLLAMFRSASVFDSLVTGRNLPAPPPRDGGGTGGASACVGHVHAVHTRADVAIAWNLFLGAVC